MARRKFKTRTVTRYAKKSRSRRSSRGGLMGGNTGRMVAAGAYGAVRSRLTSYVAPIARKLPFGNIADEVATIGVLFAAKRFIGRKVPLIAGMANAGMLIESAQIGQAIASGSLNMGGNGGGSSNGSLWDGGA